MLFLYDKPGLKLWMDPPALRSLMLGLSHQMVIALLIHYDLKQKVKGCILISLSGWNYSYVHIILDLTIYS